MPTDSSQDGTYVPVAQFLDALAGPKPEPHSAMDEALRMASAVLEIVSDYNVRAMTPVEMAELARRLYMAGAIGLGEFAVMSFQPQLTEGYAGNVQSYQDMQANPSNPRDFVAAWEEHLSELQHSGVDSLTLQRATDIVELIKSFVPLDEPLEDDA